MSVKKWAILVLILGVLFLFAPFVPYTSASGSFLGSHYQITADVSPSYYLFHCGSYINQQASASGQGYSSAYQLSQGYSFTCNYNTS